MIDAPHFKNGLFRNNGRLGRYLLAFGQDADNELYLLTTMNTEPAGTTGAVFKIVPPGNG